MRIKLSSKAIKFTAKDIDSEEYSSQSDSIIRYNRSSAETSVKATKEEERQGKGFSNEIVNNDQNYIVQEYIKKREWKKAIELLSSAKQITGSKLKEKIETIFEEALRLGQQNKDLLSLEKHCELLALNPNHLAGLRNFVVLLKRTGQYRDALFYISQYLSIKQDCPKGLNTLGTVLADMGDNERAMMAFREAYQLDPLCSNINNNLANQYHLKAQIDMAFIHASQAIEQDPNNIVLWLDYMTHLKRVCAYSRMEKVDWWNYMNILPPKYISTSFLQLLTISESEQEQRLLLDIIKRWGIARCSKRKSSRLN